MSQHPYTIASSHPLAGGTGPGSGDDRPGDDELIARVRARVFDTVRSNPPAFGTVHDQDGDWEVLCPGVARKTLRIADGVRSSLMRLAPGACVEAHTHPADEECVVLEGMLRIGDDLVLQRGDFHVGRRGTEHPRTVTETGALVFLRDALEPA